MEMTQVFPRSVVVVHPHRPTGLTRRILGLILNGKPSGRFGKEQTLSFEGNAGVSKPDVDPDQAEAEWKIFRRILFTQHRSESGLQKIVTTFLASSALVAGFPNLASLARLAVVLPVTTATVERSFSDMKLIKTRLRSRLGEETLNQKI